MGQSRPFSFLGAYVSTVARLIIGILFLSSYYVVGTHRGNVITCPPCDMHFGKLAISPEGKVIQEVRVKERGEPKSGTGFMFEWGVQALLHARDYLRELYGNNSCEVTFAMQKEGGLNDVLYCDFVFEPHRSSGDALCPCPEIDRIHIFIHRINKHTLPVWKTCSWWHPTGVAVMKKAVCRFPDRSKPKRYEDIWTCMAQNNCPINVENELQMAVFRDPRAVAVSTYFWLRMYEKVDRDGRPMETLDAFALRVLPVLCQWTSVRFILFNEYLSEQSTLFWYEDARAEPLWWHRNWLASVGLNLPLDVLQAATEAAVRGDFDFRVKGFDQHAGADEEASHRTLDKTLRNDTLDSMEPIMRLWLPPMLLERLEVPSQ